MPAPIPLDEHERLQDLHGLRVLTTRADDGLDGIVRLAADVCGAPMAAITLIDADRQWAKATVGLPVGHTPRDTALGAHIITSDTVMVVTDLATDVASPTTSGSSVNRRSASLRARRC